MIHNTPLDYLNAKIEENRSNVISFLSQGTVKSFEEYHRLCGIVEGLDATKNLIADLAKRMETDDE